MQKRKHYEGQTCNCTKPEKPETSVLNKHTYIHVFQPEATHTVKCELGVR